MSEQNQEVIIEEIPVKPKGVFEPRWKPGESGNPAGRPKGSMNRIDVRERCEALGCDPFRVLAQIANGDHEGLMVSASAISLQSRLKAATELASYIAPKLKSIEVQTDGDNETRNVYVVTLPSSGRELTVSNDEVLEMTPSGMAEHIHDAIRRDDDDDEQG